MTALADVWSLGAIIYVLIANNIISESRETKRDSDVFDFREPEWEHISEHVTEFVKACLQVDVSKRSTIK